MNPNNSKGNYSQIPESDQLDDMENPMSPEETEARLRLGFDDIHDALTDSYQAINCFWADFHNFLAQGTAVDFGVGVIVGGMFSEITSSLMKDILSPPFELLLGRSLTNWFYVLKQGKTPGKVYHTLEEAKEDGAITENT